MIWAFVDYENVGSLETLNISEYERVFVFCGPKNTRIKVGDLPSNAFCRIELIGLTTTGSNNLDFHMAFYVGRFHEIAEKHVVFHIVSNDSGFNGLVNHLKKIGRSCKKITTKETKQNTAQEVPESLSVEASLVVSRLKQLDGRKRPRKRTGLLNWIRSQCQNMTNGKSPDLILKELVDAKLIRESGHDIGYEIGR
jgi:hypothetical protein